MRNPFRYFRNSPDIIRLSVMMCIRFPLSLRRVEDLLFERGIDIRPETVRFWWNRPGSMFAAGLVLAGCQTETLPGDYASTSAQVLETIEFRATSLRW